MSKVIEAINKFIDGWEENGHITDVLLTGSYAVGNPSENSDVDLLIILDDSVNWEERGNKEIDGYIVEYIAKPFNTWTSILNREKKSGKRIFSYMFSIAEVIEGNKSADELIKLSKNILTDSLPKLGEEEIEMAKYHAHDRLADLKDLHEQESPAFNSMYYFLLATLIGTYAKYERLDIPSTSKLYKFLTDKDYRKKQNMRQFKDSEFSNIVVSCYKDKSLENIEQLANHVTSRLGGYNIKNWKLRKTL
ncbi:MAG: nucleotidyltransferase domain-containing protein [Candidatus Hodarchaeota archaeon]